MNYFSFLFFVFNKPKDFISLENRKSFMKIHKQFDEANSCSFGGRTADRSRNIQRLERDSQNVLSNQLANAEGHRLFDKLCNLPSILPWAYRGGILPSKDFKELQPVQRTNKKQLPIFVQFAQYHYLFCSVGTFAKIWLSYQSHTITLRLCTTPWYERRINHIIRLDPCNQI